MTIDDLRWLVLGEGVAIVLLAGGLVWLALSHAGCLRTVRQMQMPHEPVNVPDTPREVQW